MRPWETMSFWVQVLVLGLIGTGAAVVFGFGIRWVLIEEGDTKPAEDQKRSYAIPGHGNETHDDEIRAAINPAPAPEIEKADQASPVSVVRPPVKTVADARAALQEHINRYLRGDRSLAYEMIPLGMSRAVSIEIIDIDNDLISNDFIGRSRVTGYRYFGTELSISYLTLRMHYRESSDSWGILSLGD